MLKVTKDVLVVAGLIVLGAAIYFLIRCFWRLNTLIGMAQSQRSAPVTGPKTEVWIASGCSLLAGLLLGFGLGLPRRSAKNVREQALAEAGAGPVAGGRH